MSNKLEEKELHLIDDEFNHKEDDIDKIREAPTMYISFLGEDGALHLDKEIVNNAVDEADNPRTCCKNIDVYADENENSILVMDDGRGMPEEIIEKCCTKLQAGTKLGRLGGGGATAGQNGTGLTATNAMADFFEIISYRGDKSYTLTFDWVNGVCTPLKEEKLRKFRRGTSVKFIPSKKYLGQDACMNGERLMEWLYDLSNMMPEHVTLNFNLTKRGKEAVIMKTFKNKGGVTHLVEVASEGKRSGFDVYSFKGGADCVETRNGVDLERRMNLSVAFTFIPTLNEPQITSFCNYVNTVDHGTHVDATKDAICHVLVKEARKTLSERDKQKFDIINADIMSNMCLSLYLSTTMDPEFASQTKLKTSSKKIVKPIKEILINIINKYFEENPKELKKITELAKMNAKLRYDTTKLKTTVVKDVKSSIDEHKMDKFKAASNSKGKEIYLLEGISAKGSAEQARNPHTQALYALTGVPTNTYSGDLASALESKEFKEIVTILGCNIGPKMDISKLKYDKIIIMTDADIDGHNITSLSAAFFIKFMPELVEAGVLYKAVPPLYRIFPDRGKNKTIFIRNKHEFVAIMENKISKSVNIRDIKGNLLSKDAVLLLLENNRLYLETLDRTANYFGVDHPLIIEFILRNINSKSFKELLKAQYPEITFDEDMGLITGIINGTFQTISIDHMFFKRCKDLSNLIFNDNKGEIYFKVEEIDKKNGDKDLGLMSLGAMMKYFNKFRPLIETRFKGLGELSPDDLWETTMKPGSRCLIRLTTKDLQKDLEMFDVLHGPGDANKELIKNFRIAREDLDN